MNILPNSIIVYPDTFDKMRQFNLELKYSATNYTIYALGDRDFDSIRERLEATGIPYIYTPDSLSKSMVAVRYLKKDDTIQIHTDFIPMISIVNFNGDIFKILNNSMSAEQSKLGSKYSIIELLSGE